jgi:hypothetical protein
LNEQIYTGPLYQYRNKSLVLLFEYIQSENIASNNYLPWLNKTSLADVSYNVRKLLPYQKFQRDNDNLLAGYLDEVKPYHVVLKEFYYNYSGNDNYNGVISDFDLPAAYNTTVERFITPKLTYNESGNYDDYQVTDAIWNNSKYSSWFNNYGLTLSAKPKTVVATLLTYLTNIGQSLYVDNARGLPIEGTLLIDNEYISYTRINRQTGKLSGLSRGVNNTLQATHYPNATVYMDLPGVIVLETGRDYVDPPIVTAYIDTTKYPAPRVPAVLKSIMSGDRVIGVAVIDPGEGYVVEPDIIFQSSFDVKLLDSNINDISNIIVLNTNKLRTGDLIKLSAQQLIESTGAQFVDSGYYYINVLSNDGSITNATLHTTYVNGMSGNHRVIFKDRTIRNIQSYLLSMVPKAIPVTANSRVREMTTTLRFDRTSYESMIVPWKSGEFWPSPFIDYGNKASSDPLISYGIPYLDPEYTASSARGRGVSFTVENILLGKYYSVIINSGGLGYQVNDTLLVVGTHLGGAAPANNCLITITEVSVTGAIKNATASGIPVLAVNPNLASLQGALLPIIRTENDEGTAIVTVNYSPSTLKPGQVKGLPMYFYRIYDAYTYDDTGAGGAKIEIHRPKFNPKLISNQYYMKIINPGTIYQDGDTIVVRGSYLGGQDGVNDAVINVKFANDAGNIIVSDIAGTSVGNFAMYYVTPISNTQLKVYQDAKLNIPVAFTDFIYDNIGPHHNKDFGYLPEPLIITGTSYKYNVAAVVSYNGKVWRCIESNSDLIFDPAKWQEIASDSRTLNALDRIAGYYSPTLNMPANDLSQLLDGITYPNNIYYGNSFAPGDELPIETVLKDQPFYPRDIDIKSITFDGTNYVAVGESALHSVVLISADGKNWKNSKLSDQRLGVTDITYHGTYYVVTTTNTTTPILLSFDTENWITVGTYTPYDSVALDNNTGFDGTSLSCPNDQLYSVIYTNNKFFATGLDILTSSDGIVWEPVYTFGSKLSNVIKDINYVTATNFTGYIAVGSGNKVISGNDTAFPTIVYSSKLITSLDGLTWKLASIPITYSGLNSITSSDTMLVAVGDNGEIWYSTNSLNWIQGNISGPAVTSSLNSITYAQGVFIVVGDSGTILVSDDGITYTQVTTSDITIKNLNKVSFDGTYFYVVGESGVIFRSTNGTSWNNLSNIETPKNTYTIKGSDFLYGYGPEELVAGVVRDNLNIRVNTLPGASWDNDTYTQTGLFEHTGFNMISKLFNLHNNKVVVSFDNIVENPAQLSVYIVDAITKIGYRVYEDISISVQNTHTYEIDWINKTVVLNQPIADDKLLLVEVYEIGNGRQFVRSNSQYIPMSIDPITNKSQMIFDVKYETVVTDPIVYHNGTKLAYLTDYTIEQTSTGYIRLLFNSVYDVTQDYLSFAILGNPITEYNTNMYGYSIPETQVFAFNGIDTTFVLSNYIQEDNATNAIVELNGFRLVPTTDYTIDTALNQLVVTKVLTLNDMISVTTFNDTKRQYLTTSTSQSLQVDPIYYIDNSVSPVRMILAVNPSFADGDLVKIDGTLGSVDLNSNSYYVKTEASYITDSVTYYPFRLYTNSALTVPLNGTSVHTYMGKGFVWNDSQSIIIAQPSVTLTDGARTWVSINGNRLAPEMIKFGANNHISILTPIELGDMIIATSTISTATPNSLSFAINIDKHNVASVYRSNSIDRTWLTQDLLTKEDTIYCANVGNLVDVVTEEYTVLSEGTINLIYIQHDIDLIREVTISDVNSLITLPRTDFILKLHNNRPAIVFVGDAVEDDRLIVTIRTGDIIEISGEKIRFGQIDYVNNTLSKLTRGVEGTGAKTHYVNEYIYGITHNRKLDDKYYNLVWNSSNYLRLRDPLQLSTSIPAKFLQSGTY